MFNAVVMQGFPLVLIFLNSFLSVKRYIPPNIPLVDDNSEFNLLGYKNFLLEPKVKTVLEEFKEENPGPLPCHPCSSPSIQIWAL
jgi:hypothetical protein